MNPDSLAGDPVQDIQSTSPPSSKRCQSSKSIFSRPISSHFPSSKRREATPSNELAPTASRRDNYGRPRKVPKHVVTNACTNCRKARSKVCFMPALSRCVKIWRHLSNNPRKCDGAEPACERCTSKNGAKSCHYETPVKAMKTLLMQEIQRLHSRLKSFEQEKSSLEERNACMEKVFNACVYGGRSAEPIGRLNRGESYESCAESLDC